ncbi:MAG: insulinase family protein [Myxococcales bacterium]|nr:insulinase family protein [Myxococcales bacterium]
MLTPLLSGLLAAAAALAPAEPVRTYHLQNGLEVVLIADRRLPMIAVDVRYAAGRADDPPGRAGLAHVVEHLAHEGSRHADKEEQRFAHGRSSVHANATTSYDATEYYAAGPTDALEAILWIESERMAFVRGQHGAATLGVVKEIVVNERRERIDDEPITAIFHRAQAELYPAGHPCSDGVIGPQASIDAVTIAEVDAFLAAWYRPDNAILTIVGDLPPTAEALVERYFGGLAAADVKRPARPTFTQIAAGERRLVAERGLDDAPLGAIAWPSPAFGDAGDAALDVLAQALERGAARRLAPGELATFVVAQQSSRACAHFVLGASGRPGASADELVAAIDRLLEAVAAGELREAEVSGARARQIAEHRRMKGDLVTRARLAAAYRAGSRDAGWEQAVERRWAAVDPAAIARAVREHLTRARRLVIVAEPMKGRRP